MTTPLLIPDPFGRPRGGNSRARLRVGSELQNSGSVWPTRAGSDRAVLDSCQRFRIAQASTVEG